LWFFGVARSTPVERKPDPSRKFHTRLLEIAKSYKPFGRVDDDARWAPTLCRAPSLPAVRFSASKDTKTHGQKLYSMFAKERKAYVAPPEKGQPVGQVIVKQSWVPEEIAHKGQGGDPVRQKAKEAAKGKDAGSGATDKDDSFFPYARKSGKVYKASRQAELFIMYKLDPSTKDTDRGWVYGTVSADGKKVTAAGRLESCMKCHQKAAHDRVFGLPKQK
jgi:hypothetical protein